MHLRIYWRTLFCAALITRIAPLCCYAQQGPIKVINNQKTYKQLIKADSLQQMERLDAIVTGLKIDLRYATPNNFTGKELYMQGKVTYLRKPVTIALDSVRQILVAQGYGIKIWDAYRPYSVTKQMWELIKDERYVANPAKGSGHNRGIAVDLTLFDLKTGNELDMGTGFDNFSDTAHHAFTQLTPLQQKNRMVLRSAMEQYGFKALATEWWHYSWPDASRFPLLDLSFRQLGRLAD